MKLIVFLLIVLVIFFSIKYAKHIDGEKAIIKKKPQTNISPDSPISFGYKTSWYAVKTADNQKLIDLFNLKSIQKSNWKNGIKESYNKNVFITPPINDWTFIIGAFIPSGDSKESAYAIQKHIEKLSLEFEEVCFYSSHRVVDFYCWAKAKNGKTNRFYSYLGETDEVIEDFGKITKIETTIFSDSSHVIDEEDVLAIVANWSIPINNLEEEYQSEKGLGFIGEIEY